MIDSDLADLYAVPTRRLNEQVRRNARRFPPDFMFQLSKQEMLIWESQILRSQSGTSRLRSQKATSKTGRGGRRYAPLVFTEQGVAMLSSVLNSERAVQVNIQIVRTFTKLREMIATHRDLRRKIEEMEKGYDKKFKVVFTAIAKLLDNKKTLGKPIGVQT